MPGSGAFLHDSARSNKRDQEQTRFIVFLCRLPCQGARYANTSPPIVMCLRPARFDTDPSLFLEEMLLVFLLGVVPAILGELHFFAGMDLDRFANGLVLVLVH